jgi:hypothetical protein
MIDSSDEGAERRSSFRLDMEEELVDITWLDVDGWERTKHLCCLDFSRSGLKFECDEELPIGTAIMVIFTSSNANNQKFAGKILRCNKQESGKFTIALALD